VPYLEQDREEDREPRSDRQSERAEDAGQGPASVGVRRLEPMRRQRARRRRWRKQRLDLLLVDLTRFLDEPQQGLLLQRLSAKPEPTTRNEHGRERNPERECSQADLHSP
jgi:hypothetical protein